MLSDLVMDGVQGMLKKQFLTYSAWAVVDFASVENADAESDNHQLVQIFTL